MAKAIRAACERFPDNPNVIRTRTNGLQDVDVYDERMPNDCARWLCDYHNDFHGGSKTSFVQILELTISVEAHVTAYTMQAGISTRDPMYNPRCWESISKHFKNKYTSMKMFLRCRSLIHSLKDLGLWEHMSKMMQARCNFRDVRLQNDAVVTNVHALVSLLKDSFKDALSPHEFHLVFFEGLKFMVPIRAAAGNTDSQRSVPWLLLGSEPAKIKYLATAMGDSVVVKKTVKRKHDDKAAASPQPSPTRRKKGASVPAGSSGSNAVFEEADHTVQLPATQASREKYWLDDVIALTRGLHVSLQNLGIDMTESALKARTDMEAECVSIALQFCWSGAVVLNSNAYSSWSALRKQLISILQTKMQAMCASQSTVDIAVNKACGDEEASDDETNAAATHDSQDMVAKSLMKALASVGAADLAINCAPDSSNAGDPNHPDMDKRRLADLVECNLQDLQKVAAVAILKRPPKTHFAYRDILERAYVGLPELLIAKCRYIDTPKSCCHITFSFRRPREL